MTPKEFGKALKEVSAVIQKNSFIPVTQEIRVQGDGDYMTITGTDLNTAIKHTIASDIVLDCMVSIDIMQLLSNLPDAPMIVTQNGDEVIIKVGRKKYSFESTDTDGFPMPSTEGLGESIRISMTSFVSVISKAKDFASQDELKATMQGVNLILGTDQKMTVTAVDGHKLFSQKMPYSGSLTEETSITIPSRVIEALIKVTASEVFCDFAWSENKGIFTVSDTEITFTLPSDSYVSFQKVIPTEESQLVKVTVKVAEFAKSLKRLSIIERKDANNPSVCVLTIEDESFLSLNNKDFNKKGKEDLAVDNQGDESIVIGFNTGNALTCLAACDGEEVTLMMTEPRRPIIINDGVEKTILLMPAMIT